MQQRINPATFFVGARQRYAEAESHAGGALERVYAIGSCTVRLRFAGPALISLLTPALDHLAVSGQRCGADLTVCLWDSASTCTPSPIGPWASLQPGLRGEVQDYSDDRFLTAVQVDAGILSVLDRRSGEALYWVHSNALPVYERSAPLKVILHWWLRDQGYLMIHAGAVGHAGGAALLVGQTGTGKSTAALSCLTAGMLYISDDRCLITLTPDPAAHAIYCSGKVAHSQTYRFPSLLSAFSKSDNDPSGKSLLLIHQCAPAQLARRLPIKAILLARLAHSEQTRVEPANPMSVLRALATSTMVYAPGWSQGDLNCVAELVQRVPCYYVNLGTELQQIPRAIYAAIGAGQVRTPQAIVAAQGGASAPRL